MDSIFCTAAHADIKGCLHNDAEEYDAAIV